STITTASAIRTQYEDLGNLMHRESSGRDASLSTSGHVQVRRDERVRLRVSAIEGYAESRDRVPRHVRVRKRSPLRRLGESREGGRAGRPLLPSALWTWRSYGNMNSCVCGFRWSTPRRLEPVFISNAWKPLLGPTPLATCSTPWVA